MSEVKEPLRIANISGFYGDRLSAAQEMVDGGPVDVLTGDWLAELTMLILARTQAKRPGGGYARTFVTQMEQVMGACLDRGIKVVSNAGGLDPDGCADAVAEVADRLGLAPTIAYVNGDNLLSRMDQIAGELRPFDTTETSDLGDPGNYLSANAYIGCWGIVEALSAGADIVITGRATDAAVVCGPAAWHHGWARDAWDQLAGAVVAGHVIECGTQTTGGNYSFFQEVPGLERPGFPWADVAADGSCVIGKHEGTGGLVSVGTVTSQLLYEIGAPEYLGPDVVAHFDTMTVAPAGRDRVRISGTKGSPPPSTLKVAMNELGGHRQDMSIALTGLDIEAKAAMVEAGFWAACPHQPEDFASVTTRLVRTEKADPDSNEEATASWRLSIKDPDERKVGRAVSNAVIELALANIPGFYGLGGGPGPGKPYGVYRPALIESSLVPQHVFVRTPGADEHRTVVDSVAPTAEVSVEPHRPVLPDRPIGVEAPAPLGTVVGTRSGDKGGHANLGIFARSNEAYVWLESFMTTDRLRTLLPEAADLRIDRHPLPNLLAINFLIRGLLEEGVAASTRQDGQAKSLGEWLRARVVDIPVALLPEEYRP
jgi:hypothetical protein